jgi:hypothetical protein
MTYLDTFGRPIDSLGRVIETNDFGLSEAARPPELSRTGFAIEIRKPGGTWLPGDEAEFEQKRDDFLRWFAERRNLTGADCGSIVFSTPPDATMLYSEVDRTVRCPESTILESLSSEIRSIVPPSDLSGPGSANEFRAYVNEHSPIMTTHLSIQTAGAPIHAPHFIKIRITKEDGWHEGELETYRLWRDAVLHEIIDLRKLAGLQCKVIIFEIPDGDSMTVTRDDRQLICPEPDVPETTSLETLRSEIRFIIPPTDLAGLDSYRELEDYVSDHFPIITEHYLLQGAAGIPEDPALPIEIQMYKPGGWHGQDEDTYREWQDVTLQEIAGIRHLSGNDCMFFLFTTPRGPSDTATFGGKLYCPPP